jgi:hypothetical protein
MPTSARTSLGFFGQFADVGIRAPEQNGLLQQTLASNGSSAVPLPVSNRMQWATDPLRAPSGSVLMGSGLLFLRLDSVKTPQLLSLCDSPLGESDYDLIPARKRHCLRRHFAPDRVKAN